MPNHSEPHALIAARKKQLFHIESLNKLHDPTFIHNNLVVNGLLSAIISALISVFFFETGSYEQRGRMIFILVCILIGMFALSPLRRSWAAWRIAKLETIIYRLTHQTAPNEAEKQPENWHTTAMKREIEDANRD